MDNYLKRLDRRVPILLCRLFVVSDNNKREAGTGLMNGSMLTWRYEGAYPGMWSAAPPSGTASTVGRKRKAVGPEGSMQGTS